MRWCRNTLERSWTARSIYAVVERPDARSLEAVGQEQEDDALERGADDARRAERAAGGGRAAA